MKISLFLAASALAIASLVGCTSNTDDSGSSSNDIVGDQRVDTGATYGTAPKKETPLPDLDGPGAEATISNKRIAQRPEGVNVKLDLDFPKPPVEGPQHDGEESK